MKLKLFLKKYNWMISLSSALLCVVMIAVSCDKDVDEITSDRQEALLINALAKIPMPAITEFRELKMVNKILEDRDHTLATWTYIFSEYRGCFVFLGASIAYPIPYATQRTSPMKIGGGSGYRLAMPQADPNGLFSPASAEGTFLEMNNPTKINETGVVYSEPRLFTSPWELPERVLCPPAQPEKPPAARSGPKAD